MFDNRGMGQSGVGVAGFSLADMAEVRRDFLSSSSLFFVPSCSCYLLSSFYLISTVPSENLSRSRMSSSCSTTFAGLLPMCSASLWEASLHRSCCCGRLTGSIR